MSEHVAGAYQSNIGVDTCGVQPVSCGVATAYKPWYYDGTSVYWGSTYADYATAKTRALALRTTLINEAKQL